MSATAPSPCRRRSFPGWSAVLLTLSALASCSGGSPTGPTIDDFVGLWHVVTVDGRPLPTPIDWLDPTTEHELVSGSLVFDAGGTYLGHELYQKHTGSSDTPYDQTFTGTYWLAGDSIYMSEGSGAVDYGGMLHGDELTIAYGWGTFTYIR